jgi:hypothetical protein
MRRLHVWEDARSDSPHVTVPPSGLVAVASLLADGVVVALTAAALAVLLATGVQARLTSAGASVINAILFVGTALVGYPFLIDLALRVAMSEQIAVEKGQVRLTKRIGRYVLADETVPIRSLSQIDAVGDSWVRHIRSHSRSEPATALGAVDLGATGAVRRVGTYLDDRGAAALAEEIRLAAARGGCAAPTSSW